MALIGYARIDGAGMSLLPLRTGFDKKPAPS